MATLNYDPIEFDPFAGPEIIKVVPAIEPQVEIWTSCLIGGEDANRSYNESVSLRLHGQLNTLAMERSLQDLAQRHEALRSGFSADGKQLCIFRNSPARYLFEDLSMKDVAQQERFITEFAKKDADTAFDLVNGPLFRAALFKLNDTEHYLTLTAHHIICDGWSLAIMMQDLSKLYSAYTQNKIPALPEAPSFSKYALEQREFLSGTEYKAIEQYWIDQYKGDIPLMDIPTDFTRPEIKTYKGRRDDYVLHPDLIASIKKTGAKAGCSFVTTLLVAYEVFLHRLSNQEDIILGIPAAGQSATGNYGLVGHCVNLLPLRSHHNGEARFIDFLQQRRTDILNAYEHQQFTLGTLLKKLNVSRDASRVPVIPIVFNIDIGLNEGVDFEGLSYELISNKREYENFEIFLNATGSGESLTLEWSYNPLLFKPETIKQMMDDYQALLYAVVKDPEIKIKDIRLTDSPELLEKLNQWNNTTAAYPKEIPLHEIISSRCAESPDSIALRYRTESFTNKQINESANRLAALLLDYNIQTGDKIAVAIDRSPQMLIALLAILKSGAAYIPLDPTYPQKRIEYMLEDSAAKLLLTSQVYKGKFGSHATELVIEDAWDKLTGYSAEEVNIKVTGSDLAYIIYTSGSSGNPKGTLIEHHSLVNFLYSMQKAPGIGPDDKLLAVTTISFDIAGLELYLPLISGAELIIADNEAPKDGRILLDLVRSEKITIMQATPSTWRMMLGAGWDEPMKIKILCGGEALPIDLANNLLAKCSELWNMYGPTETTIWSTIKRITSTEEEITIGKPIDNTQIYILDQYLRLLPVERRGEIYIAGDGLARGYLNQPELTSEKFVPDPLSPEKDAKMYRTGDLGKFSVNGEIQYFGRIDTQVKIRGHRIELGAIENCLNMQEDIRESVVALKEVRPGNQRLIAYVVPDNVIVSTEQPDIWKQKLRDLLPEYMIPNDYIILKNLPLTPNGKLDRASLPEPDMDIGKKHEAALPVTDLEKKIAAIWSEALGVESVNLEDDFFELGGHSLIAAQVMVRLEKETGRRLPLTSLFRVSVLNQFVSLFRDEKIL